VFGYIKEGLSGIIKEADINIIEDNTLWVTKFLKYSMQYQKHLV
jgi:hypothetical protein